MVSYLRKFITVYRNKQLSQDIQLRFLKQLSRLLTNGYSIIDALEVIKWDKQLVFIGNQMIESLKHGVPIDQVFDRARFHHTISGYLYFVRENGDIVTSIQKCTEMYENRLKYAKKFRDITRYPIILLFIFSMLLYFISKWVLPSFSDIFQSNADVSSTISFSILLINVIVKSAIGIFIVVLFLIVIWQMNKHRFPIETKIKLYAAIPIYRQYLRLQTSFQFATHLSAQLKTGMSIKEILNNMSTQKKLPMIAYYTSLMTTELSNGFPLTNLLLQLTFFERQLTIIFQKNKDKQTLEKDLAAYADLLTDELHRKTMKVITLIQPVFFIVVGCFIVFIYLTLMWPMMQMLRTI